MHPTLAHRPTTTELDAPEFELSADHLAVLAQLPIPQAWRFCRRKRRDLVTPDFATFVRAVTRLRVAALTDLRAAAAPAGELALRRGEEPDLAGAPAVLSAAGYRPWPRSA